MKRLVDIAAIALVAIFLAVSLPSDPGGPTPLRDYIVSHGVDDTGAVNLVTAIYLGYRAYDTFGETIVLLIAVSGVMLFVERKR